MRKIKIVCNSHFVESDFYSEAGILRNTGQFLIGAGLGSPFFIITNPLVGSLYGDILKENFTKSGFSWNSMEVPDGEQYKTLTWAKRLYDRMGELFLDRSSTVVALGGGVICDIAGFVSATYMRGIPHVFIPTTLLAQVDASIGGKTGVDYKSCKNLIGAFHHPRLILSDPEVLRTLSGRQFACGLAEIIKSALISSEEFFQNLEEQCPLSADHPFLEESIYGAVQVKTATVMDDPFEKNIRAFLNFGHTIGHALEAAGGFKRYLHGEAVSIGMVAAARISEELGCTSSDFSLRLVNLLKSCYLPVKIKGVDCAKIEAALKMDKKKMKDLRYVLIKKPGEVFITGDVPPALVQRVLRHLSEDN